MHSNDLPPPPTPQISARGVCRVLLPVPRLPWLTSTGHAELQCESSHRQRRCSKTAAAAKGAVRFSFLEGRKK